MATLSLNIDARGATTGAKQFQTATNNVKTSATQAATATGGLGSAMQRMGNMSGAQRFVFQNTANQLGDIAVQASMGTNMFRVLGMQLPQIAGGFAILGGAMGTVMPIIGVLAAVGFPLIAVFSQLGSGAKSLSDQLDQLSDNVRSAREQLDILSTPLNKLKIQFGEAAEAAKEFARAEAQIQLMMAQQSISLIGEELSDLIVDFEAFGKKGNRAGATVSNSMSDLGKKFGLTKEQIEQLAVQFDKVGDNLRSGNVDINALTTDGTDLLKMFTDMNISMKDLSDAGLQTFVQGLIDLGFESARVQNLLKQLDDQNKSTAATLNDEVRVGVQRSTFEIMRFGDGLDTLYDITPETKQAIADLTHEFLLFGDGLEDATGDIKLTAKELNLLQDRMARVARVQMLMRQAPMFINMNDLDAAAELYKKLQKEQEDAAKSTNKLAAENKKLFESLGKISPEQQRVIDLSEHIGTSFENALISATKGTLSVRDAFRAMASDIIEELYRVFFVKQATGFITETIQGMFGVSQLDQGVSLRPRARPTAGVSAFGGPVSPSHGVIVGERGPEVFYPNTKGVIAPNSQIAGGTVVVNQTINVTTGVQQTVRAEILGLLPQIQEASKAAVLDAKRRGGSFAGAF